jgi:hypothetical protein
MFNRFGDKLHAEGLETVSHIKKPSIGIAQECVPDSYNNRQLGVDIHQACIFRTERARNTGKLHVGSMAFRLHSRRTCPVCKRSIHFLAFSPSGSEGETVSVFRG